MYPATSSTRVDIIPGFSKFDRTRPLALEPFVSQQQWNQLAEDVDFVLDEYNRNISRYHHALTRGPLLGILIMVVGVTLTAALSPSGEVSPAVALIPIGFLVVIGSILSSIYLQSSISAKYGESLRTIAQDMSKRLPNVTVHFKAPSLTTTTTGYGTNPGGFEFSHPNTASDIETPAAAASAMESNGGFELSHPDPYNDIETPVASAALESNVLPAATAILAPCVNKPNSTPTAEYTKSSSTDGVGATVRERLQELDKLKDVISDEEYQRERARILSSM